jgi:hypothetical protein
MPSGFCFCLAVYGRVAARDLTCLLYFPKLLRFG